jgi:tetratricopeptide (TPR) repeat protein
MHGRTCKLAPIQRMLCLMTTRFRRFLALTLSLAGAGWLSSSLPAQSTSWTDKETRLATEYLGLLVEKPDDARVLDLLWSLYDKHQQTPFLLESIAAQAAQQPHPNVLLIHAQLLQRAGRLDDALARYQQLLTQQPEHPAALHAVSELMQQNGDPAAALSYLQKLTATVPASDPRRAQLLLQQATQLIALNRSDDAAKACEQALSTRPNDPALLRETSRLLFGAGMINKTLDLMQRLVDASSNPTVKLDALFDLSRLQEQAGHFKPASDALQQGLNLLHDKDWRYDQFFQRLVKLHERFDQLDSLKQQLLDDAAQKPVTEKALNNLARYASQVVDGEERIKWLRELVTQFPDNLAHRWELVTALIDHNEAAEAATFIEPYLKRDGTDRPQLILLRALTHLLLTENEKAIALLQQLLQQQSGDPEVEKQVLTFARQKSLDPIIESILQQRIDRNPGKPEPLFELATFQRTRGNHKAVEQLFERYLQSSPPEEKQRRLNDVASFLSSSPDLQVAEEAARRALATPEAGQPEILRLADVLAQRNATEEAHALLERAWTMSTSDEQRADVDERLAAVLSGEQGAKLLTTPVEPPSEFTLPAMFSGEGFGSEAPPEKPPAVPETLTEYAQALATPTLRQIFAPLLKATVHLAPPLSQPWLQQLSFPPSPSLDPLRVQRAAWWSLRTGQNDIAALLLQHLIQPPQGQRQNVTLEVEKLYLEVLLLNAVKQPQPAIEQLRRLADLDPASRTPCLLRLAELEAPRDGKQGILTAISVLEDLIKTDPGNDAILSALAQFYLESGQRDKALALWENAARNATGKTSPILERYAELLIAQRRHEEYIQTQIRLIEQEPDIKRRRDFFQRAIERLLWADAIQGELSDEERSQRLTKIKMILLDRARRDPFEGFWNEALALVYQREGDDAKAFAAMKQAYYTAPDTPFSLEQLRVAALRVGDLKSAIYFQKQIAAGAATADQASEWRQLVQLLESDFRMGEADLARRRLEARFSQDPVALEELARYYSETAQDDAASRVLEQLVRVRGWDAAHLLRLALQQKNLGNHDAARLTLTKLIANHPGPLNPDLAKTPERWPWPIFDEKFASPTSPSLLINSIESAPGLEPAERDRLRLFLSHPRPEFVELPDDPVPVRLRAIQELVTLPHSAPLPDGLSEIELAWFHYFKGDRKALGEQITRLLQPRQNLEGRFLFVWMAIKSHHPALLVDWVNNAPEKDRNARRKLIHTTLTVLCDEYAFHLTSEDARVIGGSRILNNTEVIELAKKLENRHDYDLALDLAEAMRAHSPPLPVEYLLELARIAENCSQENRQRAYYQEIWSRPIPPAASEPHQGFIRSFSRLWGLSTSPQERELLLTESLRRLQHFPPSMADDLRKARLLGIVGFTDTSARELSRLVARELPAARAFAEPIIGRLPPGVTPPGPRIDSLTHMRDYWTDLRQYTEELRFDGLSPLLNRVSDAANRRNAGVAVGPRSTFEFNAWRNSNLSRQLRFASYPERLHLVRQLLQSDDSVDLMLDLGNFLENQGYSREAIEVYHRLIPRAPANEDYSQQLRRACENAGESGIAIEYLEKTLPAPVHFKPQQIDETLREEHARHLARLHNLPRLQQLAYPSGAMTKSPPGRVPEPVPYLKELALILQTRGDEPGALAAWEEMHRLWPSDVEASLHRARLLRRQGNHARALEALREIPLANFWNDPVRDAFAMRAELVAEGGLWDEMRHLMNIVTGNPSHFTQAPGSNPTPSMNTSFTASSPGTSPTTYTGGVLILSRVLADHQRLTDAQSLLLRAERSVRDNTERFKLRLEQIRLAAADPAWSPALDQARIAAWLRAFTDDQEALSAMLSFLKREAAGPRAQAWLKALRQPNIPPHSATSLALSTFAPLLAETDLPNLLKPWHQPAAPSENARELTLTTLLELQKPRWALQTALAGPDGGLRNSPLIIPIHHALGDRHALDELFGRLIRTTFPGSSNTAPYAEAFAQIGRHDLAGEIYDLSLQRLRSIAGTHPPLIESYARFLIRQQRYEACENLLLKEHHGMTEGLAALLVELYRGWNKLDQLPTQLAKYHLPDSVLKEAEFLASTSKSSAPEPTSP